MFCLNVPKNFQNSEYLIFILLPGCHTIEISHIVDCSFLSLVDSCVLNPNTSCYPTSLTDETAVQTGSGVLLCGSPGESSNQLDVPISKSETFHFRKCKFTIVSLLMFFLPSMFVFSQKKFPLR